MSQASQEITYRVATADDVDALATMRWRMETERHPEYQPTEATFAAYLEAARQAEIERGAHIPFVAEANGEVIACAILIWWTMLPSLTDLRRKRGYVSSVYTEPAWRRRGVARQLMQQLLERAHSMNMQRLILWASDMGRPLYLDLGFEPSRALERNE